MDSRDRQHGARAERRKAVRGADDACEPTELERNEVGEPRHALRLARDGGTLDQVMADEPLLPAIESERFRACHEEDAPALQPLLGGGSAVGFGQHRHHAVAMCVDVRKPRIGGPLVAVSYTHLTLPTIYSV